MKIKQPNFADSFTAGYEHGIKIGLDFAARQFMNPISYLPSDEFDRLIDNAVKHLWLEFHGEIRGS